MSTKDKGGVKEMLDALEKSIEQCRLLYELYFSGLEKREPTWHRQDIVRQITAMRREKIGSAVDRFRFQTLQQRFNSFIQYWNRVNLQKEQGTYFKDKQRARRRMGLEVNKKTRLNDVLQEPSPDDTAEQPTVHSLEDPEREGGADRSRLAAAAAAAATARSQQPDGSLSEERYQKIYRNYVAAKQRCGESVAGISYDAVVNSIRKQVPQLEQRGYSNIDFKVVIRDGKAALKPVARKGDAD